MKRKQGKRTLRIAKKGRARIHRKISPKPLVVRTKREEQVLEKVLAALSLSRRENLDVRIAAKIEGTNLRTILRYAPSALEKRRGKHRAKPSDRIPRSLTVVGPKGMRPLAVRSSRSASSIARYLNAVRAFVYKGDTVPLARFRGKKIAGYRFVTNLATLRRLADADVLGLERLYTGVTLGH